MIGALIKGTDWSQLTEYLSPVFFQIVPPIAMTRKIKSLVGNYVGNQRFVEAVNRVDQALQKSDLKLRVSTDPRFNESNAAGSLTSPKDPGTMLLTLYFWQIFALDEAILDFRAKAFPEAGRYVLWCPRPLYTTWDAVFIDAVRKLYLGFYQDRSDLMDQALETLGLTAGKDVLMKHFGENQERVQFAIPAFRATFHEVFLACKKARTQMHPDFLALGGMLACLYEHLERLGGVYNVRKIFGEATAGLA